MESNKHTFDLTKDSRLYNRDNLEVLCFGRVADIIVADYVYESADFRWIDKWWEHLKTDGVFIVFTDWHTHHRLRVHIEDHCADAVLVNDICWKNEWGNFPKNRMHQVHDNIVVYAKGDSWRFDSEKIQVPKATAKTKLNPSGRQTKTATTWIDDITLLTTSPERIKLNGKCVAWQKPVALMERVMLPFMVPGDVVVDLFMGVGTAGVVALKNKCHYYGIEINPVIYDLAKQRLLGQIYANNNHAPCS